MNQQEANSILKEAKLKITEARIQVLQFLDKQKFPIGVEKVLEAFPQVDKVTVYRMLSAFEEKGIVKRHDIGHDHMDYELTNRDHHHHIICTACHRIEDISACDADNKATRFLKKSTHFTEIFDHSLTFWGICKTCK